MDTLKPEYRNKIVEIYGRIAFEDGSLPARIEGIIFEWVKGELARRGEVFDCSCGNCNHSGRSGT